MWNPPIALTLEEHTIAARTRKARKFFVFLRAHRHELLDAAFQDTLAETSNPDYSSAYKIDQRGGLLKPSEATHQPYPRIA